MKNCFVNGYRSLKEDKITENQGISNIRGTSDIWELRI